MFHPRFLPTSSRQLLQRGDPLERKKRSGLGSEYVGLVLDMPFVVKDL